MPLNVGAAGAWKTVTAIWVGVGGTWKRASSVKVGVGGAWKESLGVVSLPSTISASNPSSASVMLNNDGSSTVVGATDFDWLTPNSTGVAALFECMADNLSGDTGFASGTFNAWLGLESARSFGINGSNVSIDFRLRIRNKNSQIVQASSDVTVTATAP